MPLAEDWDRDVYAAGQQLNLFPYDHVVSYLVRRRPPDAVGKPRVLEVGCGPGNNLLAAAMIGYDVAGIDQSPVASRVAVERFQQNRLQADLRIGNMTELPWADGQFERVVDRAAIGCLADPAQARRAVEEVHRVLRPGGEMLFNPFSSSHPWADRQRVVGTALSQRYYSGTDVQDVLTGFTIATMQHVLITEGESVAHAEWRVVALKPA